MRRIVLWFASTVTAVVLLFGYHTSTSGSEVSSAAAPPIVGSVDTSSDSSSTTSGSSSSSGSGGSSSGSTGSSSGGGATSTVSGEAADTRYGPVQVTLTVQDGAIVAVEVPEYPAGDGRDIEISSYALPILVQETLDAQSASIDMVSGATYTSAGYQQSLQSALDQAGV
ncbi:FMN-binding protein [Nocardioides sp. MH1]|uniref:FMN-binding protein n=1 Tax=Nocardioides sp. MH1 TaxID=3242490 RepID=UPI003520A844